MEFGLQAHYGGDKFAVGSEAPPQRSELDEWSWWGYLVAGYLVLVE